MLEDANDFCALRCFRRKKKKGKTVKTGGKYKNTRGVDFQPHLTVLGSAQLLSRECPPAFSTCFTSHDFLHSTGHPAIQYTSQNIQTCSHDHSESVPYPKGTLGQLVKCKSSTKLYPWLAYNFPLQFTLELHGVLADNLNAKKG